MKTKFIAIAAAVALSVGGVAGLAVSNQAEAQSAQKAPVILIVDQAQLVAQSKAGKTIPDQAEKIRNSVQKELEDVATKLQKDIEDFQKNQSLMSDEVRQQKGQELAMQEQYGLPQRAKIMEEAFKAAVQNAQAKILVESRPIMKDIIDKRGATVVLDRSAVMYAAVETDITQEVIAELDKKITSVEVEKISLASIEKQLKELQAKQAAEGKKK